MGRFVYYHAVQIVALSEQQEGLDRQAEKDACMPHGMGTRDSRLELVVLAVGGWVYVSCVRDFLLRPSSDHRPSASHCVVLAPAAGSISKIID